MTNYMHIFSSGHISELLYHWKNLYKYSQQGWEHMNAAIKIFFFKRTNHGGFTGFGNSKSKLKAIARWLQCRMIFMCSYDDEYIKNYEGNIVLEPEDINEEDFHFN